MFIWSLVAVVVDVHIDEPNIGQKIDIIAHLSVTIKFVCTIYKTQYAFIKTFKILIVIWA